MLIILVTLLLVVSLIRLQNIIKRDYPFWIKTKKHVGVLLAWTYGSMLAIEMVVYLVIITISAWALIQELGRI